MARLDDRQVAERLAQLEGWERSQEAIERSFKAGDFAGSVALVNRILPVAEEMNHHPDLEISWDTVKVSITTHSEGGLTANDFELAGRIDALAGA
jgi:4a-hydroxytetrahydrobiopterin dehydratase